MALPLSLNTFLLSSWRIENRTLLEESPSRERGEAIGFEDSGLDPTSFLLIKRGSLCTNKKRCVGDHGMCIDKSCVGWGYIKVRNWPDFVKYGSNLMSLWKSQRDPGLLSNSGIGFSALISHCFYATSWGNHLVAGSLQVCL